MISGKIGELHAGTCHHGHQAAMSAACLEKCVWVHIGMAVADSMFAWKDNFLSYTKLGHCTCRKTGRMEWFRQKNQRACLGQAEEPAHMGDLHWYK